jgi:glycosyltransferase involved in cell wall biosynthesis
MRLVFVTQAYDPSSTILGVTQDWVAALAGRCAGVDVIASSATAVAGAPANVRLFSLGKEQGAGKSGQLVRFVRSLARTLPGARAVFVHMVPRLAVLAFPLAAAARRPLVLWYAQGGVDRWLHLASRLAWRILTPTRDSFPLRGPALEARLVVTGHGIDAERYRPDGTPLACPPRLLTVGRLSPSKRYERLLEALALVPEQPWQLRLAGGPLYPSDEAYVAGLRNQARRLGLDGKVEFRGMVPYQEMPAEYRAAWLLAHTSATGSLDKVVLEAMACATPVISTAPSSRTAFGPLADSLWCADDRPQTLAAALEAALAWPESRRAALGAAARAEVERNHSLTGWAARVAGVLGLG